MRASPPPFSSGQVFITSIWTALRTEAEDAARTEPGLAPFLREALLKHPDFSTALAQNLGRRLGILENQEAMIRDVCLEALAADPSLAEAAARDMNASHERDPACRSWLQPFLYFKGVAALETQRVGHWLWQRGRTTLAFHLQSLASQLFQVDIHPATILGTGIFLDHATGVVIGETSTVGDDVSILHAVTLGGTGRERGDRHPKIGRGVLISAGAKILGNVTVGEEARIAAGSVVLTDVPPHVTVAGVPARPIRGPTSPHPAEAMEQSFLPLSSVSEHKV